MTNNTIPNVPRELLADLLGNDHDKRIMAERNLLAMLANAPSPAGVDGCKCSMSISMLGDGCRHCQPQEYIDRIGEMLDEERSELSDAQAIIDGLRGEVESRVEAALAAELDVRHQQAQRIGELEGLLRESRKDKTRLDQIVMHGISVRVFKYGKEFSVYGETLREALDKSITTLSAGK